MTSKNENSDIRLLDFGLSKIIGPNETCNEPYGTLTYCAPEILLDIPYNHQVDVFAIGVITYLLLCGFLPFDAENNEAEIARKTINENPIYFNFIWKNISFYAKRFVEKCLIKDPKKRITINEALNDLWFKEKYNIKDS
jgi:serine/threonine protein kinase